MNEKKMNLTELVESKPKKRNRLKVIITESQLKRLIDSTKNILENERNNAYIINNIIAIFKWKYSMRHIYFAKFHHFLL